MGGLLRYDLPGWYGVGGAEPCGTIGDPALRFRDLVRSSFVARERRNKKREIVWRPLKRGKRGGECGAPWRSEGSAGAEKRRNYFAALP